MTDVFVSYSREDRNRVEELVRAIQGGGRLVFWDHDIPPGQTWDSYIGAKLTEARCVVVVWSRSSVRSEPVQSEAHEALRRRILVPALLEKDAEIPVFFRRIQAANLADDWDGGIRILNEAVSRVLSTGDASVQQARDQRPLAAAASSGGGTANIETRVRFEGRAVGLSARVVWPFDQAIEHATATVPGSGGRSFVQQELFQFRDGVLWHRGTHASATSRFSQRLDAFEITVSAAIEGFNVDDMVTADSITARLHLVFRPTDWSQPAITPLGSSFQNLRIAGHIIELEDYSGLFAHVDTMDGLRDVYERDTEFRRIFQPHLFPDRDLPRQLLSYFPWSRYDGQADRLPEEQGQTTFPGFTVKNRTGDGIVAYGNVIWIPNFGVVRLGEMIIGTHSRRLTMLQVDFVSPTEGQAVACSVEANGAGLVRPR